MSRLVSCFLVSAIAVSVSVASADSDKKADEDSPKKGTSVYDFTVRDIDGQEVKLSSYKGKVLLIVNVASKCGLTDRNYSKLEPLYNKYREQGLRILAFPANNFSGQEPGSNSVIKKFCTTKYELSYDLFAKVSVQGSRICPLYRFLTEQTGSDVKGEVVWNFQKYLVNRDGTVVSKFHPKTDPDDDKLMAAIESALGKSDSAKAGAKK